MRNSFFLILSLLVTLPTSAKPLASQNGAILKHQSPDVRVYSDDVERPAKEILVVILENLQSDLIDQVGVLVVKVYCRFDDWHPAIVGVIVCSCRDRTYKNKVPP